MNLRYHSTRLLLTSRTVAAGLPKLCHHSSCQHAHKLPVTHLNEVRPRRCSLSAITSPSSLVTSKMSLSLPTPIYSAWLQTTELQTGTQHALVHSKNLVCARHWDGQQHQYMEQSRSHLASHTGDCATVHQRLDSKVVVAQVGEPVAVVPAGRPLPEHMQDSSRSDASPHKRLPTHMHCLPGNGQ